MTRSRLFRACLVAAVLITSTRSPAIAPPSGNPGPVVIPMDIMPSGHIAIMAKINDRGPYRFIFDTGAPALVISERVGLSAGILPTPFSRPFFTLLGNLGEYTVRSITIGRVTQPDLVSDIWNHPTVELIGKSFGPFEGLIGFPFFAHYRLTLDYKARTMTLSPSAYVPEDTKLKMTRHFNGDPAPAAVLSCRKAVGITVKKDAKDDLPGVVITSVMHDSAAERAGLKAGDRLLTLDGRWTDTVHDCYAAASGIAAADFIAVSYKRGPDEIKTRLQVKPGI